MVLSFVATNIQLGLVLHAAVVMTALKLSAALSTCDRAMKAACSSRQVGCEVLMELRGVEVSETVCGLLYRTRLTEVAWESFSVVSFILPSVWHVGSDVDQTDNRWIRPGFGNDRSAITMSHENTWSILLS